MLNWTISFLILALVFGILGFTGLAEAIANIAKIGFIIFLAAGVGGVIYGFKNKKELKIK